LTLLRDRQVAEGEVAAAHALVIGIGRYEWLSGGKQKKLFSGREGMGQLTSPPLSARAFADWLLDTYDNPDAPLCSVDLLVSDAKQVHVRDGKELAIQPATADNVVKAIRAWVDRATRPNDLFFFFFSGHGISAGTQMTLLCEDFGSDEHDPLEQAIDFTGFHQGMDFATARRQCYFVDACQVATATVLDSAGNHYGRTGMQPKGPHNPLARQAPVFQSTVAGQLAYGRPHRSSYFTEALLRAFEGPASGDDDDGKTWWVQTSALNRALPVLLRRMDPPEGLIEQAPTTFLSNFPLHRLKDRPQKIPVDVWCDPEGMTAQAVLSYASGEAHGARPKPAPTPWRVDLVEGSYAFEARFSAPAATYTRAAVEVRPHYRPVRIETKA
jgi:hypothetical protein